MVVVDMWIKVAVMVLLAVCAAKIGFRSWFKPFNLSVYLGRFLNVSESQFSHLKNGIIKYLAMSML